MILAADVGNTNIKFAVFSEDGSVISTARIKTDRDKTEDEYSVLMLDLLSLNSLDGSIITGAVLSCVAPSLTGILTRAILRAFGCETLVVGAGVKTGLDIRIDDPGSLGSDMCASAVGAMDCYGAPAVIISVGTATTITAVGKGRAFLGGVIMPGVDISLSALAGRADNLPHIALDAPSAAIAANTRDSMNAGIVYGHAGAIDGIVGRFEAELAQTPVVVATGGRAEAIIPFCSHKIVIDKELILKGLYSIYLRNKKR